jgi:GNAT superfamily N-acetyltransferase
MTTPVRIRSTTVDDIPTILHFIRALAEYEKLTHLVVASEATLQESLFGDPPGAEALLAFAGDEPVGLAVFCHNYSTFLGRRGLWLEDLFVPPAHRGKGFGKALLLACARIAKERGCGRFEWSALDWNTPAWDFYRALGATPMQEWTNFRVSGEALDRLAAMEGGERRQR